MLWNAIALFGKSLKFTRATDVTRYNYSFASDSSTRMNNFKTKETFEQFKKFTDVTTYL